MLRGKTLIPHNFRTGKLGECHIPQIPHERPRGMNLLDRLEPLHSAQDPGALGHADRDRGVCRSPRVLRRARRILEFDAGLPRAEAELEAARITATYAGIRAICGRPCGGLGIPRPLRCLATPARSIPLPFGTASVQVRESAKRARAVLYHPPRPRSRPRASRTRGKAGGVLRGAGGEGRGKGVSATGRSPVRLNQDVYPTPATA
jgi:hypothetical protein